MEITIEKGIPIGPIYRNCKWITVIRQMEAGDSFLAPASEQSSIILSGRRAALLVTTRLQPDGMVRVWRLADKAMEAAVDASAVRRADCPEE